jgi:hypothetical protein
MVKDVNSEVRDTLPRHNLPNLAVRWLCPGTASTTGWRSPRTALSMDKRLSFPSCRCAQGMECRRLTVDDKLKNERGEGAEAPIHPAGREICTHSRPTPRLQSIPNHITV